MKRIVLKISLLLVLPLSVISCSQDALDPTLSTVRDLDKDPISSETDLMYLTNGMYKRMRAAEYYGRDFVLFNEARTDDAYSAGYSNRFLNVSEMNVQVTDAYPADTWLAIYRVILNANHVINAEGITGNEEAIADYKGQAYLGRALAHFDLTKLYGQQHITGEGGKDALAVPYITSFPKNSDDALSFKFPRNTFAEVRKKIYEDLDLAIENISNTDPKYFTQKAAYGYKSRMAMYFATFFPEDWQVAFDAAQAAIGGNAKGGVIEIGDFIKQFEGNIAEKNSVFQLAMPSDDNLGNNCLSEMYNGLAYGDIVAQDGTVNKYEDDDIRGTVIGYDAYGDLKNLKKYPTYSDDVILMRHEELLLNAAEAAMHINQPEIALEYINYIRGKRGVVLKKANEITLETVLEERNLELMFEGFRFDDLMRTRQDVPENPMIIGESPLYGDFRTAFPIPKREINASGMKQNAGY